MATAKVTWQGAKALEGFLVPIDELTPWEQNPRMGDVMALVGSLRRWGQVRAISTRENGKDVIAGHHLRLAAIELGWTHIAAIPMEFESEAEADIYGLADNELASLGGYNDQKLYEVMEQHQLFDPEALFGTGYTIDKTEDIRAAAGQVPTTQLDGDIERGYSETAKEAQERAAELAAGNAMKETVLMLTLEEREKYDANVRVLASYYGETSVIKVVLLALNEMAVNVTKLLEQADQIDEATAPSEEVHPDQEVLRVPDIEGHICSVFTGSDVTANGFKLEEGFAVMVSCICGWHNAAIHGQEGEAMREAHLQSAEAELAV